MHWIETRFKYDWNDFEITDSGSLCIFGLSSTDLQTCTNHMLSESANSYFFSVWTLRGVNSVICEGFDGN